MRQIKKFHEVRIKNGIESNDIEIKEDVSGSKKCKYNISLTTLH